MDQLMSHFDAVNDFFMDPPSPPESSFKLRPIVIESSPEFKSSRSLDDSSYKSAVEFPDLDDDSDSDMEVPEFDMDFSFEVNAEESADAETSIIQDW